MVRRPRYFGIVLGSEGMFELETAIERWKQTFGQNEVVGSEESTELVEHLRESIADLSKRGLSQREAFMVGADRLGYPSELEQEYAKVNVASQWRRRIFWMLSGYIAMRVFGATIAAVVAITGTGMALAGVGGGASGIVINAVMVLAWIGLPILAIRQVQRYGSLGHHLSVTWLVAAGVLLIIAPVFATVARVAQMRLVDKTWFGETAVYVGIGGFAVQVCIVAFCLVALCKLYDPAVSAVE